MKAFISSDFWSDPDIEDLPPEEKLALLWVISNEKCNLCGFTEVSRKRFTFDTGLKIEVLQRACQGVAKGFTSPLKGFVWSKNYVAHQFGRGPALARNNMAKSIMKHLVLMRPELQKVFLSEYPELKGLAKGLVRGSKAPPKGKGTGTCTGTGNKKEVEELYQLYPLKKSKEPALKAIEKALTKVDFETIKTGIENYKLDLERTGSLIAHCSTWMNQERWEDEPTPELPKVKHSKPQAQRIL